MRIVDLSHTIETLPRDLPSFMRVEVSYSDHAAGAVEMEQATVACFPLKIKGASAGVIRAAAILDEALEARNLGLTGLDKQRRRMRITRRIRDAMEWRQPVRPAVEASREKER